MENNSKKSKKTKHTYLGLILLSFIVIFTQVIVAYVIYKSHYRWEERGQFGDMFGGLNALFSGLAFAGVVYAIFLQRGELDLQLRELISTTKALNQQTKLMRDSNNFEVLTSILIEYRRPEMASALSALWRHWRSHPEDLVQTYDANLQKDDSLHAQRRFVSQFYGLLAGLKDRGLMPPELLYQYWRKSDLAIIPEILIPIELYLKETNNPQMEPTENIFTISPGSLLDIMERLYYEAPD